MCSKSLYKAQQKGTKVKKSDAWAWCRNRECELFGKDLSNGVYGDHPSDGDTEQGREATRQMFTESKPMTDAYQDQVDKKTPSRKRRKRKSIPAAGVPPGEKPEPEAIQKARQRIRELLKQVVPKDAPPVSIGLTLALVNQETGNTQAANVLIDEYQLEDKFGVKKF